MKITWSRERDKDRAFCSSCLLRADVLQDTTNNNINNNNNKTKNDWFDYTSISQQLTTTTTKSFIGSPI